MTDSFQREHRSLWQGVLGFNVLSAIVLGIVGFFVGERLGVAGYLGAFVILAGIFIAEGSLLDRSVKERRECPDG